MEIAARTARIPSSCRGDQRSVPRYASFPSIPHGMPKPDGVEELGNGRRLDHECSSNPGCLIFRTGAALAAPEKMRGFRG